MIVWPAPLRYAAAVPNLSAGWREGGPARSGQAQRVIGDLGPWRVTVEGIVARGPEQIALAQAMLTRLKSGETIAAPVCERAPLPGARAAVGALTADAALRATQLSLALDGAALRVGALLGIAGRVHRVVEIVSQSAPPAWRDKLAHDEPWEDASPWGDAPLPGLPLGAAVVRILPGLRAAAAAGTAVALRDLTLICRLADAEAGDMPAPKGRSAQFDLSLVESL